MKVKFFVLKAFLVFVAVSFISGCAINFYKKDPRDRDRIRHLTGKVSDLEQQIAREKGDFEHAKEKLETKWSKEIGNKNISLEVGKRGLVITLSNKIIFDSGKAEIKRDAKPILDEVADIIIDEFPTKNIGVEGHTDNVPIKHSGWKSNWELSTSRATSVVHYLIGQGIKPSRLSAIGYGEFRPVASNETEEGRRRNRRVEIVILPEFTEKNYSQEYEKAKTGQEEYSRDIK